jgi:HSP20 family protein
MSQELHLFGPTYTKGIVHHNHQVQGTKSLASILTCDLIESPSDYHLYADLPGVSPEDLEVKVEGKQLVISAERKYLHSDDNHKVHTLERSYGKVTRALRIPDNVNMDKVDVKFKWGVLLVTFPKTETPAPIILTVTHHE